MRSLALLLLLAFICFSPALDGHFLNWDDNFHVSKNPHVLSLSWNNIGHIFQSTVNDTYIPLTILIFAVEQHFWGLNAFVFHLDNLLLHLVIMILIFLFARRLNLSKTIAYYAALIFAIHPMHVESVAWITARKDVLYSLFYLLALDRYWQYAASRTPNAYAWSLLCALLSILSKPMALSLPWILLLLDYLADRPWGWRLIVEKIPFLIVIEPIASITYVLHNHIPPLAFPQSLLMWIWSATFYLEKFFFPFSFIALYQPPRPIAFSNFIYLKAVLIFIVFLGCLWFFRRSRWFVFAGLFYIGSTFFLWRYAYMDVSFVADRFMYLPSLGWCVLLAVGIDQWVKKINQGRGFLWKPLIVAGMIAIGVTSLCLKTWFQCRFWRDDVTLWNHVIRQDPLNPIAYRKRGIAFSQRGQHDLAIADLTQVVLLKQNDPESYNNRGYAFLIAGRYKEAVNDFHKALALLPHYPTAAQNLALAYQRQHDKKPSP